MSLTDDEIRARAHRLWESEGRPDGRSDHYWFLARDMLVAEGRAMADGGSAFRPVDAAEAPPEPVGAADGFPAPSEEGGIESAERPPVPLDPAVDPNSALDPGQGGNAPISEIESIRRTLEVPKGRRGRGVPTNDRAGAMSGQAGSRKRS
ncbi:DUF2934 domain-containing protein [Ancylobacter sp. IITR112]|uniref:DUF2934 domain-containing protein n=1 Tax=Ancylobacter sp. IITR112 TaxID=3138073 RepID=UPI00352B207A